MVNSQLVPQEKCPNDFLFKFPFNFGLQWHPSYPPPYFPFNILNTCLVGVIKNVGRVRHFLFITKNISQFDFNFPWDQEANADCSTDLPENNFGQPFAIPKAVIVGGQVPPGNEEDSRFVIKLFRLTKLAVTLNLRLCLPVYFHLFVFHLQVILFIASAISSQPVLVIIFIWFTFTVLRLPQEHELSQGNSQYHCSKRNTNIVLIFNSKTFTSESYGTHLSSAIHLLPACRATQIDSWTAIPTCRIVVMWFNCLFISWMFMFHVQHKKGYKIWSSLVWW